MQISRRVEFSASSASAFDVVDAGVVIYGVSTLAQLHIARVLADIFPPQAMYFTTLKAEGNLIHIVASSYQIRT